MLVQVQSAAGGSLPALDLFFVLCLGLGRVFAWNTAGAGPGPGCAGPAYPAPAPAPAPYLRPVSAGPGYWS